MEPYQDLKNFRLYSMKKILKIFLNYRYKILHGIHPKTFGRHNIRQFFETAYLQTLLALDGIELIYIDEFSFNT